MKNILFILTLFLSLNSTANAVSDNKDTEIEVDFKSEILEYSWKSTDPWESTEYKGTTDEGFEIFKRNEYFEILSLFEDRMVIESEPKSEETQVIQIIWKKNMVIIKTENEEHRHKMTIKGDKLKFGDHEFVRVERSETSEKQLLKN